MIQRAKILLLVFSVLLVAQRTLTLKDCIQIAKENNRTLLASEKGQEIVPLILKFGFADLMPTLNMNITSSWSNSDVGVVDFSDFGTNSNLFSLDFSTPIYSGIFDFYNIKRYKLEAEQIVNLHDQTAAQVVFSVKQKYFNLMKAQETMNLRRKDLELSREQMSLSKKRVELGQAVPTDIYQAEIAVRNSIIALLESENLLESAIQDMELVLGQEFDENTKFSPVESFHDTSSSLSVWESEVVSNNLNLVGEAISVKQGKLNETTQKAHYFPKISFAIGYKHTGAEFDHYYSNLENYWDPSAYFTVSYSIFDAFERKRNIAQAKINTKQSQLRYLDLQQQKLGEVRKITLRWKNAQKVIKILSENVDLAGEQLALAQQQYALGVITLLDLQNSQLLLTRAEIALVQERYDGEILFSSLELLAGYKW